MSGYRKFDEIRVTNDRTGGEKGSKSAQLAWAPAHALSQLAEVYGFGAAKYDPHNFRKGYDWSLSLNALWRHVVAFQGGEDLDPESGLAHMAHAAWHCLTLIQFMQDHPELDDRFGVNREMSLLEAWEEAKQMLHDTSGVSEVSRGPAPDYAMTVDVDDSEVHDATTVMPNYYDKVVDPLIDADASYADHMAQPSERVPYAPPVPDIQGRDL